MDGDEGEPLGDVRWEPWTPWQAAERLRGVATRWYVVAGWALDLFRGEVTRPHEDLEIGVPAAGFAALRAALADHEVQVVGSGRRWPLASAAMDEHFQTWFRDPASGAYHLDVFRDPHDGDEWICRRDPAIRRPYDALVRTTPEGVPFLAPEVVLLFKAKHVRDKDQADFSGVAGLLDEDARRWLVDALDRVHPGHPWRRALAGAPEGPRRGA